MRKFASIIIFFLIPICSFSQSDEGSSNVDLYRISAVKKIEQYKDDLIALAANRNSLRKSEMIRQIIENNFTMDSDIEDDLSPSTIDGASSYKPPKVYLSDYCMFFIPDSDENPLEFSSIKAGPLTRGDRTYVEVVFRSVFLGRREGAERQRFLPVLRLATIYFEDINDPNSARIVTIYSATKDKWETVRAYADSIEYAILEQQSGKMRFSKENELQYNHLIKLADEEFKYGSYISAREYYEKSLKYMPGNLYAEEKILDIIKIQHDEIEYAKHLATADSAFKKRSYLESLIQLDSAELFISGTNQKQAYKSTEIQWRKEGYLEKYRRTERRKAARYLGINFTAYNVNIEQVKTVPDQVKSYDYNYGLNSLGVALYRPLGGYISNINLNDKLPNSIYTSSQMETLVRSMQDESINFTNLSFSYSDQRVRSLDAGLTIMVTSNLFLKTGARIEEIRSWDLYTGDLKGFANRSDPGSIYYAVDGNENWKLRPQIGLALVIRFIQLEAVYTYEGNLGLNIGLNYPYKKRVKYEYN